MTREKKEFISILCHILVIWPRHFSRQILSRKCVPLVAAFERAENGATLKTLEDEARAEIAIKEKAKETEKKIALQKAAEAAEEKKSKGRLKAVRI
jgi:hypothetical protein